MAPRAFITGCAGLELSDGERSFFRSAEPWGLILFARNLSDHRQIRALASEFREAVGRADAPVLIDQEGGRVQRLRPPLAPHYPPAGVIAARHDGDPDAAARAAWIAARLIAEDLFQLGITVDCVPVLDLKIEGAHGIIGDRSYGSDPANVAYLARAAVEGLRAGGVAPVGKHLPGHGRALADSHAELPSVTASHEELSRTDFMPFRLLSDLPMGMTAHVLYTAIDPENPATLSQRVVGDIIRGEIGFGGLLMTDDLSMGALSGSVRERAAAAFSAGCDVALHCNGDFAEMLEVAEASPELSGRSAERAEAALSWPQREETDLDAARHEFAALMADEAAGGLV